MEKTLIFPYNNFILVNFNYATAIISQHLVINFIYNGFILEACEIIYFFNLKGIYKITLFVNEADLDIVG